MNIPLDEVLFFDAITTSPSTGAATDADSTPTFAVYEESTDTDIGVGGNMTKRTSLTGNYRGTFTASAANGFEVGKWYSIIATATVSSITGKAVIKNFRVCAAEAIAGKPKTDVDAWLGTAASTPTTAGIPNVNAKTWNDLATVALPLTPTTAGRTLDVSSGGEAGIDWANVGSPTTTLNLSGTTIATTQQVDVNTIKTQAVTASGGITFPAATLASTTNITAGTITTATNLTNAPTAGDFTSTMKTSLNAATPAVTVSDKTGFSLASGSISNATFATTPGTAGGLLIAGSNAATTFATLTSTGAFMVDSFSINGSLSVGGDTNFENVAINGTLGIIGATVFSDTVTIAGLTVNGTTTLTLASGTITAASIASDAITAAKIANGAIDAATFASGALDAVWSTAARTLTAGTNIVLPSNGLSNVTAWTVDITGNLSGSVGSVTNAVTITGDAATAGTRLLTTLELDGSVYRFTANALEEAPTSGGGGLTAQETRDAMKLAPTAGAAASGSIDAKLDALGATGGTGANVITVTVTDGTDPLENAYIRVNDGITPAYGLTDVNGNAAFSLNNGTYDVSITKTGYSFAPTTRTVTGDESGTLTNDLEMTLVSIPAAPSDPTKGTVFGSLIISDGSEKSNIIVTARLVGPSAPYSVGPVLVVRHHTAKTDDNGQWSMDLYGNADITPTGTYWHITVEQAKFEADVTVVAGQVTNVTVPVN